MTDEAKNEGAPEEEWVEKDNLDQPAHGSAVTNPVDTQSPGGNPNNRQDAPADEAADDADEAESGARR